MTAQETPGLDERVQEKIQEQIVRCDEHLTNLATGLNEPNRRVTRSSIFEQANVWLDARLRLMKKTGPTGD